MIDEPIANRARHFLQRRQEFGAGRRNRPVNKETQYSVFVQDKDLTSPLGVAVLGDRVIVSSSPSVFAYKDTDGDGKSDNRQSFLTGFGGFDHDHQGQDNGHRDHQNAPIAAIVEVQVDISTTTAPG